MNRSQAVVRPDEDHFAAVGEKLAGGRLIPFLGAGANLCGREEHREWRPGGAFLPSGSELADHLAQRGRYPLPDDRDLSRVAQYVGAARGEDELYLYVREVLDGSYGPTPLHKLLARVARNLSQAGRPQLMVVTSNYDDLVERALADEGLDFDVVWYEAKQRASARGRFMHRAPGRDPVPVTRPNKYAGLPITLERPAILKLHGCLDRDDATEDSYVITEDSYIRYLSNGDVGALIPISLWQRLTSSSLLFLGYALRDWNVRVVLNRVFEVHKLQAKSWAVLLEADDPNRSKVEQALWGTRSDIEPVHCELAEYVRQLESALPAVATGPGS
jgi:NAD-dependent SIR2 family protein deacetylase